MESGAGNIINELDKLFKESPGYEGMKATINVKPPTKSINFFDTNKQDEYHKVLGCALLMNKDDTKEIEYHGAKYKVFNDVDIDEATKEDTVFFISDYQIFEALDIIDGIYTLLLNNKLIDKASCRSINKIIIGLKGFTTLDWILDSVSEVNAYLGSINNESIKERIIMIISWIWFIPYGKLDDLYKEMVDEYNSSKNDSDGDVVE